MKNIQKTIRNIDTSIWENYSLKTPFSAIKKRTNWNSSKFVGRNSILSDLKIIEVESNGEAHLQINKTDYIFLIKYFTKK